MQCPSIATASSNFDGTPQTPTTTVDSVDVPTAGSRGTNVAAAMAAVDLPEALDLLQRAGLAGLQAKLQALGFHGDELDVLVRA